MRRSSPSKPLRIIISDRRNQNNPGLLHGDDHFTYRVILVVHVVILSFHLIHLLLFANGNSQAY